MNIIALSDIHGRTDRIEYIADELTRSDVILIAGDITDFGNEQDTEKIINAIRRYNDNVLAVPGNCDSQAVARFLTRENINLEENSIDVDSVVFFGFLTKPEHLINSQKTKVFVNHFPPANTKIDLTSPGKHAGQQAARKFIEDIQPALAISGHIHQAKGIDKIGKTTIANPGAFYAGNYLSIVMNDKVEHIELKKAGQ